MKILPVCILSLFLPIMALAQELSEYGSPELPKSGQKIADFVPDNFVMLAKTESDFNADGINDFAAVLQTTQSNDEQEITTRILLIAFGNKNGGYNKVIESSAAIYEADEGGGMMGDPFGGLESKKASLFMSYGGGTSGFAWGFEYQFKYLKDNFYLIGCNESQDNRSDPKRSNNISYNYLTNKKQITYANQKSEWVNLQKRELISLDKFSTDMHQKDSNCY